MTTEARFRQRGQRHYSEDGTRGFSFWRRYLADGPFDRVHVLARPAQDAIPTSEDSQWEAVEGPGVTVSVLGRDSGKAVSRSTVLESLSLASRSVLEADAVVARVPGVVATIAIWACKRQGKPYSAEVVGDPWQAFGRGASRFRLRSVYRVAGRLLLRGQVRGASVVSYVTVKSLQSRYPASSRAAVFAISDVQLPESSFAVQPKDLTKDGKRVRLITIGSLAQPYKGVDTVILATSLCVARGLDVELVVVGDGRFRTELELMVSWLGIDNRVRFAGSIPRSQVLRELSEADVFALASRAEGMPRALLEAMAAGLPCVATPVGDIPELLQASCLVPPDEPSRLAATVERLLLNDEEYRVCAARNLATAHDYALPRLSALQWGFLRRVSQST